MAAQARTLDVAENQVCINFDDDANFRWHHRLLIVAGLAAGEWIAATPDGEILLVRLSDHLAVALTRNAPFPQRVRGNVYTFGALDEEALEHLRTEGRNLARVLGVGAPAGPPGARVARWIISDPAVDGFGEKIEAGLAANPDRFVGKDAVGIALIDDETGWVAVENAQSEDQPEWLAEKQRGPGRDPRALSVPAPGRGKRAPLSVVLAAPKPVDDPHWPFRGPKALKEFLDGVEASGLSLTAYWGYWVEQSGVSRQSGCALQLKVILEVLFHALVFDRVDVTNLASFELLARRALQIQRAVKRCPRHPTFEGLDLMLSSELDDMGGVVTSRFGAFIAEEQKNRGIILKQERLWREEQDHEAKKYERGTGSGGPEKGEESGRRPKKTPAEPKVKARAKAKTGDG